MIQNQTLYNKTRQSMTDFENLLQVFLKNSRDQEPITKIMLLLHIPATAFSQIRSFRIPREPQWSITRADLNLNRRHHFKQPLLFFTDAISCSSSVAAVVSCFCFIFVAAVIVLGLGALFLLFVLFSLFVLLSSQRVGNHSCETLRELLHHPRVDRNWHSSR